MAEPLATVAELEKRLGVPVGSIAGEDLVRAQENLADASELVRTAPEAAYDWTPDNVHPAVKVVVLQMVKRAFKNPDDYTSESTGASGATYAWQGDQNTVGIYLSDKELSTVRTARQAALSSAGGWTGTGSVRTPATWYRRSPHNEPWEWRP